jgi:hypothetical protein
MQPIPIRAVVPVVIVKASLDERVWYDPDVDVCDVATFTEAIFIVDCSVEVSTGPTVSHVDPFQTLAKLVSVS